MDAACAGLGQCSADCPFPAHRCPADAWRWGDPVVPCSGHGTCNMGTGTCTCFRGYVGDACKRCDSHFLSSGGSCRPIPGAMVRMYRCGAEALGKSGVVPVARPWWDAQSTAAVGMTMTSVSRHAATWSAWATIGLPDSALYLCCSSANMAAACRLVCMSAGVVLRRHTQWQRSGNRLWWTQLFTMHRVDKVSPVMIQSVVLLSACATLMRSTGTLVVFVMGCP